MPADPHPQPPLLVKLALGLFSSLRPSLLRRHYRRKGFVLPVAILIVLVLSVTTVGLLNRSTDRNRQTSQERASQITNRQLNSALDRARAKIQALVADDRLPRTSPNDGAFQAALADTLTPSFASLGLNNPYDLPDETRFTLTSTFDPTVRAQAWYYPVDTDDNGTPDAITAYMLIFHRSVNDADPSTPTTVFLEDTSLTDQERADYLLARTGPLRGLVQEGCADVDALDVLPDQGSWFRSGSSLFKPFQAYAVTLPLADGTDSTTRAVAALQYQQDRRRDSFNSYGAFTRSDLELFNTPPFDWNGRIYAGGSLFFDQTFAPRGFTGHLISDPDSCFYMPIENSEVSARFDLVAGSIGRNAFETSGANYLAHSHPGDQGLEPVNPDDLNNPINNTTDSADQGAAGNQAARLALDPLQLVVADNAVQRNYALPPGSGPGWNASPLNIDNDGRVVVNSQICPPYVDDVYRSDRRFGPKPSYDRPPIEPRPVPDPVTGLVDCQVRTFQDIAPGAVNGTVIANSSLENNTNEPLINDGGDVLDANTSPDQFGLDGYWENRATYQGLKVIVGQRLELTSTEPIPLPDDATLGLTPVPTSPATALDALSTIPQPLLVSNLARQRMTMRDNLAAVQATAVYHYTQNDGLFPVACLATTVHPGTPESLARSSTFLNNQNSINFFTGTGTNVWEFAPPAGTPGAFATAVESGALGIALENLGNFAGDLDGAYPPLQEAGAIHPDPVVTRFGNFSELRQVMARIRGGTGYGALSIAEQTTLHTSACMVEMLAWNIEQLGSRGPAEQAILDDINDIRDRDANGDGDWLEPIGGRPIRNAYLPLAYIFPNSNFSDASDNPARRDLLSRVQSGDTTPLPTYDPAIQYQSVTPTAVAGTPRPLANWQTPLGPTQACPSPNSNQFDFIRVGGSCRRVGFKDSALYDGREAMAVRALNIDMELLTANVAGGAGQVIGNDSWLPSGLENGLLEGGTFYAFREDAVREDAIARPALQTWTNYLNAWNASTADLNGCGNDNRIMNAGQPRTVYRQNNNNGGTISGCVSNNEDFAVRGATTPIGDPPPDDTLGISPKAVDYYPDPDRRPYGFRLRNGETLQRGAGLELGVYGLSFISDNPVYIQGDFNLHRRVGTGTRLEEFDDLLTYDANGNYTNFYSRAG
jgi:type II secretory pathway pseudopilin PulG